MKKYKMEDTTGHDKDLNDLFKIILGTDVTIKDNMSQAEEEVFKTFIEKLDTSFRTENKVFEEGGIDLSKITDGLWFVIENVMGMVYGEEAKELVFWYVYDRFNPDGSIVPLEGPNGKTFLIKNPNDLWGFIKYKSNK